MYSKIYIEQLITNSQNIRPFRTKWGKLEGPKFYMAHS